MRDLQATKAAMQAALPQIQAVLPKSMSLARFAQVCINCVSDVPGLLDCTPTSFFRAVRAAAELGLEPSGAAGHAWIIPFRDKKANKTDATLMIGYKGFVAQEFVPKRPDALASLRQGVQICDV